MCPVPESTRREFLQGKAAADTLAEVVAGALPPIELPEPDTETYLVKFSRRAMACQFEIFLNAGQYPGDTEAALAALDLVDRLEGQLSVYRPDSEISRLNARAAIEPVSVELRLFALVEQAVAIHDQTEGAYDVTAGPLSSVWGFKRRAGSMPDDAKLADALAHVGSRHLELDATNRTIRFRIPGVEINLGSIGKGYALDRCAELLEAAGIRDFLLHGGNSSVLARGDRGGAPHGDGWWVGVRNPLRPDRRTGQVRLNERALATSGSGTQFFISGGRRYGHILDPRTGRPAEGVLSVTVLASSAAQADALSTALYVMGPDRARLFCTERPDRAAIIFSPGQREGSMERNCFALDEHDWKQLETQ